MNTQRLKKDKALEDTGERMVPVFHKSHLMYGEHILRYKAAQSLVTDMTVLDIACGSGYGTKILADKAKMVSGVDLDKPAIKYAQKNYAASNIKYLVGDCIDIPHEDNQFDAVVSFETIEHIPDYNKFISEVKRVLKPNGLLILSTPNDTQFPEGNEYHVHEFTIKELEALLNKNFKHTDYYYQTTWLYDGLFDKNNLAKDWNKKIETIQTAPVDPSKSVYYLTVCSDSPIQGTIEPLGALSEHWNARDRQQYESSIRAHIEDQGAVIKHLDNTVKQQEQTIGQLKADVSRLSSALDRYHNLVPVKVARKLVHTKRKLFK